MQRYVAEFIGTFMLVLVVAFSGNPVAIGLILAIMVYTFANYSGSHFNPAVTSAMIVLKKISLREGLKYIGSQALGSLLALLVYRVVMGKLFITLIPQTSRFMNAFLVELILTFIFVLVILNMVAKKAVQNNQYFGFVIGLTITIGAYAFVKISSGVFNPAIGVVSILTDFGNVSNTLRSLGLYLFAPTLGGVLAALLFDWMEELNQKKKK